MPQNKNDYKQLPRQFISKAIKKVVYKNYRLSITPALDLPLREIKGAEYKRPDYAFASFGLAQVLKIDPKKLASSIARGLKAEIPEIANYLDIEVVGGYVNFVVNENYLVWTIRQSTQMPLGKHNNYAKRHLEVISTWNIQAAPTTYYKRVYELVIDIYSQLNYLDKNIWQLEDNSELAALEIATAITKEDGYVETSSDFQALKKQHVELAKLEINIKKILSSPKPEPNKYSELIYDMQSGWSKDFAMFFGGRVSSQSSVKTKVHKKIDKLCLKYPSIIIKDIGSQGTFYNLEDAPVSLRTASGFLYDAAYILYLLDERLKRKPDKKLLLLPLKYHPLINSYGRLALGKRHKLLAVADISQFANKSFVAELPESVEAFAARIRVGLNFCYEQKLYNSASRQDILRLIDLPLDMIDPLASMKVTSILVIFKKSQKIIDKLMDRSV